MLIITYLRNVNSGYSPMKYDDFNHLYRFWQTHFEYCTMNQSLDPMQSLLQQYRQVQNIVILGGGPSLQTLDLAQLHPTQECLIICCNQAFQLMPQAQIAHHSDYQWWKNYQQALDTEFQGQLITGCGLGSNASYPEHIHQFSTCQNDQLASLFQSLRLTYGNNCGLQALALAHLFQPESIWLAGFDFKAQEQRSHGYVKYDHKDMSHYEKFWGFFLKDFSRFERLRHSLWPQHYPERNLPQIYNLNADSALKLYPCPVQLPPFLQIKNPA